VSDRNGLGFGELLALLTTPDELEKRLAAGALVVETPFVYPGRRGSVVVQISFAPPPSSKNLRFSDAGGLIRSLQEQGMDPTVDAIVSRTVFHAVKEVDGAAVGKGAVYLDGPMSSGVEDFWRFLQLMAELIGLRHAKYKDALVQLSRRAGGQNPSDMKSGFEPPTPSR